ncbi:MAG: polymer-forming cytoskeletal protein [Candidatus Omnitrophota bacterium]
MFGKVDKAEHKILDVDANMQGNLIFKDPVNLCISGNFDGNLDTKGSLVVSEKALVKANIKGDTVIIAGKVIGDIFVRKELKLLSTSQMIGNVKTPSLSVEEGAILQGHCEMISVKQGALSRTILMLEEVAEYLEVDVDTVESWAENGKIPAFKQAEKWNFDKSQIDMWVATEKVK